MHFINRVRTRSFSSGWFVLPRSNVATVGGDPWCKQPGTWN